MQDDTLHIVYATDIRGIELCCTSIYSIIRRKSPSTMIKFYVLADRFQDDDRFHKLHQFIKDIELKLIPVDSAKLVHATAIPERLGSASHLRALIPDLEVFQSLHRVLYLDTDMFCRRDLSHMYHSELDGYSIGMVKDASGVLADGLWKWPTDRYFHKDWFCNTGWMLMDLDKLRKNKEHQKWLQAIRENKNPDLNDQNLINTLCHYDVKLFPPTYQLSYHNLIRYRNSAVWSITKWNKYYGTHYDSLEELVRSSYLWHFHENKEIMMHDFPKIKEIITFFINDFKEFNRTGIIKPWSEESDKSIYIDLNKK